MCACIVCACVRARDCMCMWIFVRGQTCLWVGAEWVFEYMCVFVCIHVWMCFCKCMLHMYGHLCLCVYMLRYESIIIWSIWFCVHPLVIHFLIWCCFVPDVIGHVILMGTNNFTSHWSHMTVQWGRADNCMANWFSFWWCHYTKCSFQILVQGKGGRGANYSTGVSMYTIWHGRPRRCVTCAYPKCMWIANHSRRVCSTALVVSCPTRVSRDLGVACVSEYHTLGRVIFIGTKECRLINYDKLLAENWPLLHCVYVCVCIVCMVVQYVCI